MAKRSDVFDRGYDRARERFSDPKYARFARSCFTCQHFYQARGDTEELCQNENVSEYDMVRDGANVYCLWWSPYCGKKPEDTSVFRRGRSQLQ